MKKSKEFGVAFIMNKKFKTPVMNDLHICGLTPSLLSLPPFRGFKVEQEGLIKKLHGDTAAIKLGSVNGQGLVNSMVRKNMIVSLTCCIFLKWYYQHFDVGSHGSANFLLDHYLISTKYRSCITEDWMRPKVIIGSNPFATPLSPFNWLLLGSLFNLFPPWFS